MDDVVVTNPFVTLTAMQVCAKNGLMDEFILSEANRLNPSGTTAGWCEIVREGDAKPGKCADHLDRTHYIIIC